MTGVDCYPGKCPRLALPAFGVVLALWACAARFPRPEGILEFRDAAWEKGQLLGHVVYVAPSNDKTPRYHLYLGDAASEKYTQQPVAVWHRASTPLSRYTHVVGGPVPREARSWLLYPVDIDGNEGEPLALPIVDDARASVPYEVLHIRGDLRDAPKPVAVYRNAEELQAGGEAFVQAVTERVDFTRQSLLHFVLVASCPGEWGARFLGLSREPQQLNVHVHVWSTQEAAAACYASFWLTTERILEQMSVELVPFSECPHPMFDCPANRGGRR
jgi:hypothetical protein